VCGDGIEEGYVSHWLSPAAETTEGLEEFKEGLARLRQGDTIEALVRVSRALESEPKNPFFLSYAGLLTAMAEEDYDRAEQLCQAALALKWNHAQLYLNLAEVYERSGRTPEAIDALQKGLLSAGRDFRIRRALERLGVRRPAVLPFLERTHVLNRTLGKLRHRMSGPARAS
jgi:Flp pilus assembly protein TadD